MISLGITIFALVTTGPGVLAVSTGLNAMKGIMKLVWNEVGPGALLNLGTIVVKRFASVMKQIATKPAAIGRSFAQIGRALGAVISGSTPGVRNIFFNIRSKNGFDNFLAIFGAAKCATVVASIEKPRSSRLFANWQQSLTDLLISSELALIRTANAAESSCRIFPLAVFGEIANDAARFGDKATAAKVSQSLMKIALDFGPKFDGLSNEALSGLAYFGYVRHGSSGITKTEFGRMQALFIADKFPVAEVNTGFEMVNTISRMGAGFLAKTGDGGNGGHVIIKMLGSLGVIKANPTGALHTLNDMKARGYLTEGAKFEVTEPSRFFGVKRRTDLKIPKKINGIETFLRTEYKGSKSLGGRNPYNNKEFLYDVMIFLDKNESFEWVLAKGYHDLAPVAKSMIAGLNSKALEEAVAKQFTKGSDAYLDAFEKIEDMIDVLRHHPNEYLRFGAY